nr:retropepsin-like aspartic protease [Streptococcus dysgalactiae]
MFPNEKGVHLGIIPVKVEGPRGSHVVNALLDTGADTSLIREDLADRMGLSGDEFNVNLCTAMGKACQRCQRVSFKIRSIDGLETIDIDGAYTVPVVLDVNATLPEPRELSRWSHLKGVSLQSLPNTTVSLLIGLDVPEAHWVLEQRRGRKGDPYADRTPLGWVLRGPIDHTRRNEARTFAVNVSLEEINANIKKLYDREFEGSETFETTPSREDERAMSTARESLKLEDVLAYHGRIFI